MRVDLNDRLMNVDQGSEVNVNPRRFHQYGHLIGLILIELQYALNYEAA